MHDSAKLRFAVWWCFAPQFGPVALDGLAGLCYTVWRRWRGECNVFFYKYGVCGTSAGGFVQILVECTIDTCRKIGFSLEKTSFYVISVVGRCSNGLGVFMSIFVRGGLRAYGK